MPRIDVVGDRPLAHGDGFRHLAKERLHFLFESLEQAHLGIVSRQHAFGAGQLHQQAARASAPGDPSPATAPAAPGSRRSGRRSATATGRLRRGPAGTRWRRCSSESRKRIAVSSRSRQNASSTGSSSRAIMRSMICDCSLNSAWPRTLSRGPSTRTTAPGSAPLTSRDVRTVDPGMAGAKAIFASGGDDGSGSQGLARAPAKAERRVSIYTRRSCLHSRRLRVGVLGAGAWATFAHLPGFSRDPRCEVVALADPQARPRRKPPRSNSTSRPPAAITATLLARDRSSTSIDVCTPSHTHFELAWAALEAGKHVLCEKPVAYDFRDTRRAAAFARVEGTEDQARLHVPLRPGDALLRAADRRGLRRQAVHLQRLRAELAVARPADAAAPGGSQRRSSRCCRSRRSKATARRSSTSATAGGRRSVARRRHDAQLHPRAHGARRPAR